MPEEEIKPNAGQAPTQDAELAAQEIASGEEKAPTVDMEADYAAAKQLSVSDVDRTSEGAKEAKEATASKQELHEPEETKTQSKATGKPDDYLDMAKEVGGSGSEAAGNVDDDLVKKAIDKGQPK